LVSDKVNSPFSDAASIAQALKYQIRTGKFWDDLSPAGKEALDQIATSIGRTVSGDGVHWDAIIGFAQVAKPAEAAAPTVNIEHDIRRMVREIPQRTGDTT
jgi:hypothetical protein